MNVSLDSANYGFPFNSTEQTTLLILTPIVFNLNLPEDIIKFFFIQDILTNIIVMIQNIAFTKLSVFIFLMNMINNSFLKAFYDLKRDSQTFAHLEWNSFN